MGMPWKPCDRDALRGLIGVMLFDRGRVFWGRCYESGDLVRYGNWFIAAKRHVSLVGYEVWLILEDYVVSDVRFVKSSTQEVVIVDPFDADFVKKIIDVAEVINSYRGMFAYQVDALFNRYVLNVNVPHDKLPSTIEFSRDGRWVETYVKLPKPVCDKIREVFGNAEIRLGYGGSCA